MHFDDKNEFKHRRVKSNGSKLFWWLSLNSIDIYRKIPISVYKNLYKKIIVQFLTC